MNCNRLLNQNDINDDFLRKIKDKNVIFTNGCFDILHSGHIELLKKCKENGDILIVGLNTDNSIKKIKGINRPIIEEQYRAEMLLAIRYVDYVILFNETTPINLIKSIRPYMYIKGGDYTLNNMVGNKMGIKEIKEYVKYAKIIKFEQDISTSKIINKILSCYKNEE